MLKILKKRRNIFIQLLYEQATLTLEGIDLLKEYLGKPAQTLADKLTAKEKEADEARRILARIEWHFTPKHGSWLNLAEVELAALHGQCLERRIPDLATLQQEVDAWAAERNARRQTIAWSFTADEAYAKLRHVYPVPNDDTVR